MKFQKTCLKEAYNWYIYPNVDFFAFKWSEDYNISSVASNVKEKLVFPSQFSGDWKSMNRRQMKTQNGRDLALWEQICTCVYKSTPFHICRYIWSGWHKIHNFLHSSAFIDSLSNREAWNLVCFQDQKRNMVTWLGKIFSNNFGILIGIDIYFDEVEKDRCFSCFILGCAITTVKVLHLVCDF